MDNNKHYKGIIAIIVNDKDQVLMGKKIEKLGHFMSGAWHIPGGKMEEGETVEAALIREMKEELGVELKPLYILCDYPVEVKGQTFLSACYICEQADPNAEIKPSDDLQDAKYVDKNEVGKIHHTGTMQNWPKELKEFFGIS